MLARCSTEKKAHDELVACPEHHVMQREFFSAFQQQKKHNENLRNRLQEPTGMDVGEQNIRQEEGKKSARGEQTNRENIFHVEAEKTASKRAKQSKG